MKAYHIDRFGSIGGIVRRSAEDPRPGPKEVLMRVRDVAIASIRIALLIPLANSISISVAIGTSGSNPLSSSGESRANLTSWVRREPYADPTQREWYATGAAAREAVPFRLDQPTPIT
jgi:hypothetical protein